MGSEMCIRDSIWLMPLIAVMLTSIRTYDDILAGNYWGWPKDIAAIENYSAIFEDGRMARYFLNSMIITLPTVFGTLLFSSMAGFSLAMHKFKLNILLFCMFIAGNFVPFQILMIPVRGLTVDLGIYNTYYGSVSYTHLTLPTKRIV